MENNRKCPFLAVSSLFSILPAIGRYAANFGHRIPVSHGYPKGLMNLPSNIHQGLPGTLLDFSCNTPFT